MITMIILVVIRRQRGTTSTTMWLTIENNNNSSSIGGNALVSEIVHSLGQAVTLQLIIMNLIYIFFSKFTEPSEVDVNSGDPDPNRGSPLVASGEQDNVSSQPRPKHRQTSPDDEEDVFAAAPFPKLRQRLKSPDRQAHSNEDGRNVNSNPFFDAHEVATQKTATVATVATGNVHIPHCRGFVAKEASTHQAEILVEVK